MPRTRVGHEAQGGDLPPVSDDAEAVDGGMRCRDGLALPQAARATDTTRTRIAARGDGVSRRIAVQYGSVGL